MKNWLFWLIIYCVFPVAPKILAMYHVDLVLENKLSNLEQNLRALSTALDSKKPVNIPVATAPEPQQVEKAKESTESLPTQEEIKYAIENWVNSHRPSSAAQQQEARKAMEAWANDFALFDDTFNLFDMLEILSLEGEIDRRGLKETAKIFFDNKILLEQILQDINKINHYDLDRDNLEHIFYENKFRQLLETHKQTAPALFYTTQRTLESLQVFYQQFLFSEEQSKVKHKKFFRETTKDFWLTVDDVLRALKNLQKKYGVPFRAKSI